MSAIDFETKRLAFIEKAERNCSCTDGRCNICHLRRAAEEAIEAAKTPVTFEEMFAFYEEAGEILGIPAIELQKKLHSALKKLFY